MKRDAPNGYRPERLLSRRHFVRGAAGSVLAAPLLMQDLPSTRAAGPANLRVGQGVVDITPPSGQIMAGFHYGPGNERRVEGVRRPTAARALVIELAGRRVMLISVDICAISRAYSQRVRRAIEAATGINADDIRLCMTHTHSTPTWRFFRQWGELPTQYMDTCEAKLVEAARAAVADLAPAAMYVGSARAEGANFNRTRPTWKDDAQFDTQASDDDRWLDTLLHVMHFERLAPKRNLLWYHFSAHTVCYTDRLCGPDWPGEVDRLLLRDANVTGSFLQGHCGDVNPGGGTPWLGSAEGVAPRIVEAIGRALNSATRVSPSEIQSARRDVRLSLDIELLKGQLDLYQRDSSQCGGGEWVDPSFASSWYEGMLKWNLAQRELPTSVSLIQLGDVGLFFHGSELFSYYGLKIRHALSLPHVINVGYTDDFVGYLTDPSAHDKREYAASVVPKICDLPPFVPTATRQFADQAIDWAGGIIS